MKKTIKNVLGFFQKKEFKKVYVCGTCASRRTEKVLARKDEFVLIYCRKCFNDEVKRSKEEIDW